MAQRFAMSTIGAVRGPLVVKRLAAVGTVVIGLGIGGCGGHTSRTARVGTAAAASMASGPPLTAIHPPVVVASGIPFAANLAFDSSGRLWVTSATLGSEPAEGVWYVPPGGRPRRVAGGLAEATALTWIGARLYVADNASPGVGQITVFGDFTGTRFKSRQVLLDGLADGIHPIGAIVQGPDGELYTGLGAAEDHSGPPGHIVSFSPNGGKSVVVATGVGNIFGLAFWGQRLLVTMPGPNDIASPPARLLAFTPGARLVNFGFPTCYGQASPVCTAYPAPLARFAAHSAPTSVVVKGDVAFVAENGSATPGYSVPSQIERVDLRTGRVNVFWRSPILHDLVGLALGPDGNLYATLLVSGKVVRFDL
jgi:hypothetical protein